ncbi:membrane protein [[Pantoea] beijingensis]|uniref:Membrane protein n=1 Tax=[Pantoea] beijingensis TaxID=1324864 RepID=A0A443IBC6_9GAMM|nr:MULTISPECIES: YlaC family protein [Erwiniaceae]RWR01384.1 membrane protein [[Pantoea] beijingensis]
MDEIKQILQREIDTLNREELRDNKPRFSFGFLKTHPGLWLSMYICYALSVALIFTTDFLGWPAFWGATIFILVMSVLMLMDINPKYRFEDIDTLDLRVCYNGEWYYVRTLSDEAVNEILNHHATPENVKTGIRNLLNMKGEVDFYDVYSLTWGRARASAV